jgi:hypothetical protein
MDHICQIGLIDWKKLNGVIGMLNETQLKEMLDYEVGHGKRSTVVVRLHQRFTSLRATRERNEMLASISND